MVLNMQTVREMRADALRSAFETPALITQLDACYDGSFTPVLQSWRDYWLPVERLGSSRVSGSLLKLKGAWWDYVASSFDPALAREYCFRYFSLLDAVLSEGTESSSSSLRHRAFQAVLGFECFTVNGGACGPEGGAAGTTTLRNPCYLLAKLKSPDAHDDTRLHPLIFAQGNGVEGLFHHYRRYRVREDPPMSLLVYPPADPARRPRSFRLIPALASTLGSVGDPYAHARAESLWVNVLRPILQGVSADSPGGRLPVELVDIGAGSGALTADLSRELVAWGQAAGLIPHLRVWLLDLATPSATSQFRTQPLGRSVDNVTTVGMDYRAWLASPRRLPTSSGLRIALALKVFDMASTFSIRKLRTDVLSSVADAPELIGEKYLPERCLSPGRVGQDALQISSSRVFVPEGHAFPLASLSGFFRGLRVICQQSLGEREGNGEVWLPVRSLDAQSLVTTDGASVIGRLLEQCDYLIIGDADMRAQDLTDHLRVFSLDGIAAQDMTRAMQLKANYAYVLWHRDRAEPSLEGERIW